MVRTDVEHDAPTIGVNSILLMAPHSGRDADGVDSTGARNQGHSSFRRLGAGWQSPTCPSRAAAGSDGGQMPLENAPCGTRTRPTGLKVLAVPPRSQ
jgi:hypothetical protein